jgi:hypothetical protein
VLGNGRVSVAGKTGRQIRTGRQTEGRQTNGTDRQTDRQTDRDRRDRQTGGHPVNRIKVRR